MKKPKSDHCIIRNQKLFCTHCGRDQIIPFPVEIDMFCAMTKQFSKTHKNCAKTWTEPVCDMSKTQNERALFWWKNGERGASSEAIYRVMTRTSLGSDLRHPLDPSDFHRCYKLLLCVPEWKQRIDEMRTISKQWDNLSNNWEKLTALLEEQIAGKENNMYDVMQDLIK